MKTVHKYQIPVNRRDWSDTFPVPNTAKVLLVGEQDGLPTIWLEVNLTHAVTDGRKFRVFGTGWDIPESAKHVGSYQNTAGFVWHVFEVEQ